MWRRRAALHRVFEDDDDEIPLLFEVFILFYLELGWKNVS